MTDRDMSGALFPNDKGDNPSRPDWRGDVTINGVKWTLAAWTKQGRKGAFLSLSASEFKPREESRQAPASEPRGSTKADLDGEIPF